MTNILKLLKRLEKSTLNLLDHTLFREIKMSKLNDFKKKNTTVFIEGPITLETININFH